MSASDTLGNSVPTIELIGIVARCASWAAIRANADSSVRRRICGIEIGARKLLMAAAERARVARDNVVRSNRWMQGTTEAHFSVFMVHE